MFIEQWNGVGFTNPPAGPPHQLYTDASGSWGCGAFWNLHWFQLRWDERSQSLPITIKEMLPIILSAAVWGPHWPAAAHVTYHCNNSAVVASLSSRSSKVDHLMHLMRCLFYIEAYHGFTVHCTHLPGAQNTAADALSRNVLPIFHLQVQGADPSPTPLPAGLLDTCFARTSIGCLRIGQRASILLCAGFSRIHPPHLSIRNTPVPHVL